MTSTPEPFPPSEELAELIDEVQALARKHTKCDWGAVVLYLPLVILTQGLVHLSTEDESALKTTPVPDAWVVRAAQLHSASLNNLKRLHKALQDKGYVSIQDADRFCCVELERERQSLAENKRQQAVGQSLGAAVLAARIEAAQAEPTFQEAVEQGRQYLAALSAASSDLANAAVQQGVRLSRGVSAAADVLRGLRRR